MKEIPLLSGKTTPTAGGFFVLKIVRNIYARTNGKIPKHVTPHVIRHTTATAAMQSGMPIVDISKLLGHEKVDTTMIYAHVASADVQTGHRKHVV